MLARVATPQLLPLTGAMRTRDQPAARCGGQVATPHRGDEDAVCHSVGQDGVALLPLTGAMRTPGPLLAPGHRHRVATPHRGDEDGVVEHDQAARLLGCYPSQGR